MANGSRGAIQRCCYTRTVTLRRLAVAAILAVCLGAPIAEMFDQWDHTYQDGNDTEANLVVAALCVGVALSIAGVVIARVRAMSSRRAVDIFVGAGMVDVADAAMLTARREPWSGVRAVG